MSLDEPATGLAVPIRLPPGLARIRRRWDRAARAGAQPHVTVLYPFIRADLLTPTDRAALAAIAGSVAPFEVTFRRVRRFDEGVVWIEPDPSAPFRALTDAVAARWPAAIEAAVRAHLPFGARADRLELWRQDEAGRWQPHWRLRLGAPVRP
jgi:2'-5' RNA ligase